MAKDKYAKEVEALGAVLTTLGELEPDQQAFILKTAAERLGAAFSSPPSTTPSSTGTGNQNVLNPLPNGAQQSGLASGLTPKQFMAVKSPQSDVERVTCLAYYLTHERNQPHFKTEDISALNTQAALPKLSNAAYAVSNATKNSAYLSSAGNGNKQITGLGEEVVLALPDREAVKSVNDQYKSRRRKKRVKKTTKPKR